MRIRFGSEAFSLEAGDGPLGMPRAVAIPVPALGSAAVEEMPFVADRFEHRDGFSLWRSEDFVGGVFAVGVDRETYSDCAHSVYGQLFDALGDQHYLYRTWNYAPTINEGEGDEEAYRQFCKGRSLAFSQRFGEQDALYMPAGTCVGSEGRELTVVFLAGRARPEHFENSNQVPAYRYPRRYGPRSPSFARATAVTVAGRRYRFIAGTSSILGHESVGVGDIQAQLGVTCDNLEHVSAASALGGATSGTETFGKVYLRRESDFELARSYLRQRFPEAESKFVYLRSDICRRDLLVEIELWHIDAA